MGQLINVESSVIDDVAVFDTDRSIAGQDGAAYGRSSDTDDGTFPGHLAARLLAVDESIDHVWVASNEVVVRRAGGWDDHNLGVAHDTIRDFFLFYPG